MKVILLGLILSFSVYGQQGVVIKNIEHKDNLTSFLFYEQGNGLSGYIVADCKQKIFGYGESINKPNSISFENFVTGTPNEKYALGLICPMESSN